MSAPGYYASPWPGEDGGPSRAAAAARSQPLGLRIGDRLTAHTRDAFMANMVVLRDRGEVFLQGCSGPVASSTAFVERIDAESLETIARSADLDGGPFWPGGIAVHQNGDLYLTYGRWCHRLAPDLSVVASTELPAERPYNGLIILPSGHLAMKDADLDDATPARIVVLDPDDLEMVCEPLSALEPAIARLGADGDDIYVIGTTRARRLHWDANSCSLEVDDGWSVEYRTRPDQSYGWDPTIVDGDVWWMDNGAGATGFAAAGGTMVGCGDAPGSVHLFRSSVDDAGDVEAVEISGRPRGFICNPPLYDPERRLAVAFDAGNGVVSVFGRSTGELMHHWSHELAHAAHMLTWPDTGELLVSDFRKGVDHAVVLDLVTGEELARVATGSPVQSAVFPAPGWSRDAYVVSFAGVTRITVEEAN